MAGLIRVNSLSLASRYKQSPNPSVASSLANFRKNGLQHSLQNIDAASRPCTDDLITDRKRILCLCYNLGTISAGLQHD